MIIVMEQKATPEQITAVKDRVESLGFKTILNQGELMTVIAAIGDKSRISCDTLATMGGVKEIVPIREPYKQASRETHPDDTVITFPNGVRLGGDAPLCMMAGPCSVEDDIEILFSIARAVKAAGATFLRGGAYKPRTSPYDFQGMEEEGLKMMARAREATGLLLVTEVMDSQEVPLISDYADMLQIGARNMQNFKLLKAVGAQSKPVLLKRGLSATIKEFLLAAEYIMHNGNPNVALCERGIRTFDSGFTRNVLDLAAVPVIKKRCHLPVVVDPSHGTGQRYLVPTMAKAAVVSGAHGLMIEVHPDPDNAWSDGQQTLTFSQFETMMREINALSRAMASVTAS
ncbi:MAG: 3-deoxy-7-phosphoheptulonate synthase [Vampirovibrionales bacterium]|nr:3-deoxy-7-phosphoheptulonate synthase [Vampirovibrionales bacterium]